MAARGNTGKRRRSRREFIAALGGAAFGLGVSPAVAARKPSGGAFRRGTQWGAQRGHVGGAASSSNPVVIFSKHLQWLDYEGMAEVAAEMGFDGVDLTVRPRGHVLPERVEEDLPRAVEAVREAGLAVHTMTTAISDPDDPLTEPVLKTASELGIRCYRLGYWFYDPDRPIPEQLEAFKVKARGLADMNAHYGMCGDYQNHAGAKYVGAAIWDLWEIIKDLDPEAIGCQFDARHATVEGGTSWPVAFKLIADRAHTIVAKDFTWRQDDDGWEAANVPLGLGAVDFESYFPLLKKAGFDGTVIVHYEYPLGGANRGAEELGIPKKLFTAKVEADLAQVRHWLDQAGLSG